MLRNQFVFVLMMLLKKVTGKSKEFARMELKTGDLLFTSHPSCNLSKAIDQATQTGEDTHYSHIGIVEREGDKIKVFHSSPKNGVCCESLDQFLHPNERDVTVTVYRLKEQYLKAIPQAIDSARQFLGERYNHSFRHSDPGYYCSEFIYKIYAPEDVFNLYPMTFKDPGNGEFISAWVEYYSQLGISIPEGEPGCNPNGMAASDKLEFVGELKKVGVI